MCLVRNTVVLVLCLTMAFCAHLSAEGPRRVVRFPDASILSEPIHESRPIEHKQAIENVGKRPRMEDSVGPIGNVVVPTSEPELEPEYRLEGVRAKETPAGPRRGRYCENGFARSGYPNCIGRFALPSVLSSYRLGYVGGGTAIGGERRQASEGTFGFDYSGSWFSRKTWLLWSHGERYQGGAGRYETDGPRIFPE
ncbi:MAG: hypothetical protein ABL921_35420 [Pirellula sp.]